MDFRIIIEWDEECGINLSQIFPLMTQTEQFFKSKDYGESVTKILMCLTCVGYDWKQRKRFKKDLCRLDYDIILDYFMIKNVPMVHKIGIVRRQIVELSEQVLSKYKFDAFDKETFLIDLKHIVNTIQL